jgi:predicted transcriptional regulator of viral defense system
MLSRLVTHGLVDRVARGRYAIRPIGALGTRAASEDVALAVAAAFGRRPHRIAYRSALDHHGLIDHPSREIIVALDRSTSTKHVSGRRLRTVLESPHRIGIGTVPAGHGAQELDARMEPLAARLNWTLLDPHSFDVRLGAVHPSRG